MAGRELLGRAAAWLPGGTVLLGGRGPASGEPVRFLRSVQRSRLVTALLGRSRSLRKPGPSSSAPAAMFGGGDIGNAFGMDQGKAMVSTRKLAACLLPIWRRRRPPLEYSAPIEAPALPLVPCRRRPVSRSFWPAPRTRRWWRRSSARRRSRRCSCRRKCGRCTSEKRCGAASGCWRFEGTRTY